MKRRLTVFIVISIAVPIIIDWVIFANIFPSHISNDAWAGFLGSYIGGVCTMAAVFITIFDNNKKIREQEKQRRIEEQEEKRLRVRPYLDTRYRYFDYEIKIGNNDRIFDIENEHTKMVSFDISDTKRNEIKHNNRVDESRFVYVNYIIRNVGAGSAVNMVATINGFAEKMVIVRDEKVQLLCIVYLKDSIEADLKIKLEYTDVEERGQYEKEEIIHIETDESNELVSKMVKRETQRTVGISKNLKQ